VRRADIVVAACGKAEMVKGSWIKPGAVVIDVGINAVDDASAKRGYRLVRGACGRRHTCGQPGALTAAALDLRAVVSPSRSSRPSPAPCAHAVPCHAHLRTPTPAHMRAPRGAGCLRSPLIAAPAPGG
jgi:hypothetical protein